MQLNTEDGGNRRFILVEMEPDIARKITAERLRRVIQGYEWKDQKGNPRQEAGLGGGFRYCELGETLFDAQGRIRQQVSYGELAQHVFFCETGRPLTPSPPVYLPTADRSSTPLPSMGEGSTLATDPLGKGENKPIEGREELERALLGVAEGRAVYLLYNGVLKDKSPRGGNVLTQAVLETLPEHEGPKVIYGTGCRIGAERLKRLGITFRQIPYEVKAS